MLKGRTASNGFFLDHTIPPISYVLIAHSAWSESSAARPRPRGRRRGGEKMAPGTFATFQRRGPQGRAHIWGVFSCNGAERDEWRGPKGRAGALAIVVLRRKEDRAVRPAGPSRRAHFC